MADAKSLWSWMKIAKSGEESFYIDSMAYVRVGMDVSDCFRLMSF